MAFTLPSKAQGLSIDAGTIPFETPLPRGEITRFPWLARFCLANLGSALVLACALALGKVSAVHLFLLPLAWSFLILFDWEERKTVFWGVACNALLFLGIVAYGPERGMLVDRSPEELRVLRFFTMAAAQALQIAVAFHFFLNNRRRETALAEAGEAARIADQAKSRFLANMSHEIRTPLNGILGMSSLLIKSGMREDQKDLVETIQTSGFDLMSVIGEILDLSKLEAGKMRMEMAPFMLHPLLESVLKPFEMETRRKRLLFGMEIEPDLPACLLGDSTRLGQVIRSLLDNAVKFTSEGGVTIRIRGSAAEAGEGRFLLEGEVEDTGIGIAESDQSRVFQPFSQAAESSGPATGGTGLGLFICKQIVGLMGGTIGFRSRPGEGSVFRFAIPFSLAEDKVASVPAAPDREGVRDLRMAAPEARLLIVEDHPLNQKVLSGFLTQLGCRADAVSGGEEAIEAFASFPYDLIFMDCHMPGMDGYECTRILRSSRFSGRRPVIIGVTADAMHGVREKCLEAGMDEVVTKPILAGQLHRALSRWIRLAKTAPAPGSAIPPSEWVDIRHLREMNDWIRSYDPAFWRRAEDQFRGSALRLISAMRESALAGRIREAGEAAHSLKGLCLMMGLSRMGATCLSLEAMAGEGRDSEWIDTVSSLETYLEPSLEEMRKQVGQG